MKAFQRHYRQELINGLIDKECLIIAKNLSISDKTVSTYKSRIFKKMNMKNTANLIYYAIENNIID